MSFEYIYVHIYIRVFLLSRVNCSPHKNNLLELKHSFPLDDPFCPYKVVGVLEVFNEALSTFVHNLFHCGTSSFLTLSADGVHTTKQPPIYLISGRVQCAPCKP